MMPLDSALYHNNVFRDLKVNNIAMSRYNFTLITLRNIKFKISFATQLEVWELNIKENAYKPIKSHFFSANCPKKQKGSVTF